MSDVNGVMMQYFHWYVDPNLILWNQVKNEAKNLADAGFTALWLPPAYKCANGTYDVGYAVYDMYDLGEFNQKGTVRTKYGTKDQYLDAINALHSSGVQVYGDVVLNHKIGADETQVATAIPFYRDNRTFSKGGLQEIESWTKFYFPGRNEKYSNFKWQWWHFDAVDYDARTGDSSCIYVFQGKRLDDYVSQEFGNYDYLMGADLDFDHKDVRDETIRWGKWYLDTTKADGFRLDAIKHISTWFFRDWLDEMRHHAGKDLFVVGEYWVNDKGILHWYLDNLADKMSVFDVPIHYNFHQASRSGGNYDMRTILNGTLMKERPWSAVTLVENHDSQPLQALESPVEDWFKPLAYAIILLRREGYPCVFYADYYGADYEDRGGDGNTYKIHITSHRWILDKLLYARKHYAYGAQYDYFDHFNTIGWTRIGNSDHPKAMAVIMSDGSTRSKWMEVRKPNTKFVDLTEHIKDPIYTNEWGWAEFRCNGGSVSVWVEA
jgi:alpha-amylase